ncbi:MAG: hypothetical protein K6F51_00230 [Acetatifactor sp.]|nr:hypothetical protein [Acetatifactor sp.]
MKTRYKLLSIIAFLILFFCGLSLLYRVFSWKDTSGDYFSSVNQFYSMKHNVVDVAFFGPSTTYSSINPAIFWENCGIAAFNNAVSGQDRNASTYYVKEVLKTQSPKVIVLSASFFYTDVYAVPGNLLRNTLSLKESPNSVALINELVTKNDAVKGENEIKDYYLRWPIVHSRYRELQEEDFHPVAEYENCLGYQYSCDVGNLEGLGDVSFDLSESTEISAGNKQWIDNLKKLSEEQGFQLLILSVPTAFYPQQRACLNGCFQYLDEIGVPYLDLNFHMDEMDFVPATDMADRNHYNVLGARKICNYLSDYLTQNYSLPDRRGQKGYERYDQCLETYYHKCLEVETLPSADAQTLVDVPLNYTDLIVSITLHPESEPRPEFVDFLEAVGASPDEIAKGGTWLWKDGSLIHSPSRTQYGYQLTPNKYIYVTPTDVLGADQVFIGKDVCVTSEMGGSIIIIYDAVLDKVITLRQFE